MRRRGKNLRPARIMRPRRRNKDKSCLFRPRSYVNTSIEKASAWGWRVCGGQEGTLAGNQGLVGRLTTPDSSSSGFHTLFWPLWATALTNTDFAQTHVHTDFKEKYLKQVLSFILFFP